MPISSDVSAVWDQSQKAVFTVLEEQDSSGLWKTLQASVSSKDKSKWTWHSTVDNIGLHTFVIERLLRDWSHLPVVRVAVVRGLRALLHHGVEFQGKLMWRWLKVPTRPDFLYSPDYDDTARAVAVLEIGREILRPEEFDEVISGFEQYNFACDFAASAQRDLCWLTPELVPAGIAHSRLRAVCTFVGGLTEKPNNTADPIVNTNVLYGLAASGVYRRDSLSKPLVAEITNYLSEVVRRREEIFARFYDFSDYYLSPCLFAYLCAQVRNIAPELMSYDFLCDVVDGVTQFTSERHVSPEEAAWALVALASSGIDQRTIATRLLELILSQFDPQLGIAEPTPVYRHKRLDHYYGSTACSTLFCLEGLRSYWSIVQNDPDAATTTESARRSVTVEV